MKTRSLALFAVCAVAAVGCSSKDDIQSDLPRPSREFCNAAARYDETITAKRVSIEKHIELSSRLFELAPKDIKADAAAVVRAYERLRDGDRSVIDNPEVKAALNRVNRRTTQDCGWFQRQGM